MPKLSAKNRLKSPESAPNARPKKIVVSHGGGARALFKLNFDMRSKVGKWFAAHQAELIAHLGGEDELTPPLRALIDTAGRLSILAKLAWSDIARRGLTIDGQLNPAADTFMRATAREQAVLETLGLQRREKELPSLQEYLQQQQQHEGEQ